MKLKSLLVIMLALICTTFYVGCEDDHHSSSGDQEEVQPQPQPSSIKIVSFGSPNCSKAVEDPEVQIANLKINGRSGLSYSWAKGNLSKWGLANDEAGALAIAGYKEGDVFVCAKFDWISTSRRTRDFVNINSGYNGWPAEKFHSASKRCFFIMSANGKKRTNIITE